MNIIERFKNRDFYVVCNTEEQCQNFLMVLNRYGIYWEREDFPSCRRDIRTYYRGSPKVYIYGYQGRSGLLQGDLCYIGDDFKQQYSDVSYEDFMHQYCKEFNNKLR